MSKSLIALVTIAVIVLCSFDQSKERDSSFVKEFRQELRSTRLSLTENLETAIVKLDSLSRIADGLKDSTSQLSILEAYCNYHLIKNDINQLMVSAQELRSKAVEYKSIRYESNASLFITEVYTKNGLYSKAEAEINNAVDLLELADSNDIGVIYGKANAHIMYAHIYEGQGLMKENLDELFLAQNQFEKLQEPELRRSTMFVNLSNIALTYALVQNIDSAKYFLNKSISLRKEPEDFNWVRNYYTLGLISQLEKDYENAILNFQEAEAISNRIGDMTNLSEIYLSAIETAKQNDNYDLEREYLNKANNIELKVTTSKNKALKRMIDELEIQKADERNKKHLIIAVLTLLIAAATTFSFWYIKKLKNKKNLTLEKTERVSLLEMAKNDDPSFMHAFEQNSPDFAKRLKELGPELSFSELEICALIKLKLNTKQIARVRGLSHRTIQNKKYLIRKKLNISSEESIDDWFDKL